MLRIPDSDSYTLLHLNNRNIILDLPFIAARVVACRDIAFPVGVVSVWVG